MTTLPGNSNVDGKTTSTSYPNPNLKGGGDFSASQDQSNEVSFGTQKEKDNAKNVSSSTQKSNTNVIDVVNSYDWTNSTFRDPNVPYIELTEYRLKYSSHISSLYNSYSILSDSIGMAKQKVADVAKAIQNIDKDSTFKKVMESLKSVAKTAKNAGNSIVPSDKIDSIKQMFDKQINELAIKDETASGPQWNNSLMTPYKYLYLRESTNNKYKLPYFTDTHYGISNDFKDSASDSESKNNIADTLKETIVSTMDKISQNVASPVTLMAPGSYIERPKFYDFKQTNESFDISFILYNTLNEDAYKYNCDFINRFVIANTPARQNKILADPPVIYEVTIPGRIFCPYAYVSKFSVDHVGVRRLLPLSNGNQGIVPDAFKINISITSLIIESSNLIKMQTGESFSSLNRNLIVKK